MNCKYTKYVLPAVLILTLMPLFIFHLSFNNNDDQLMFLFSNGMSSKFQSNNLLLIHPVLSFLINKWNGITSARTNTYSLFLYTTLSTNIILLFVYFAQCNSIKKLPETLVMVIFIFLGYFLYFYLELEFTSVSLLLVLSVLYFIITNKQQNTILYIILFVIALLWRKESGIVFFLFSLPLWVIADLDKKKLFSTILTLFLIFIFIYLSEKMHVPYMQNNSFEKIKALDMVCARPSYYLHPSQSAPASVQLLKQWFCADELYLTGDWLAKTGELFSINFDISNLLHKIIRLIKDEQYGFLLFGLTLLSSTLSSKKHRRYLLFNLIILIIFLTYLLIFYRAPKRLILPILIILSLVQFHIFITSSINMWTRYSFILLISVFCIIKTYKLFRLSEQHKQEHIKFNEINNTINSHPEYLFVANPQTIMLNYLNTLTPIDSIFINGNIIIYGWINLSPDFKTYLQLFQLTNLTSDLINRDDILFINDDKDFESAYIRFMKDVHHVNTEFINVNLSPLIKTKKLLLKREPSPN